MILGLLLIAAAFSLTGINLAEQRRAGASAEQILFKMQEQKKDGMKEAKETEMTGEIMLPDYLLNPDMEMPTMTIDGMEYIGTLSIPALSLTLPVLSQWSYPGLRIAPARYAGSAYTDNLVIAAHNYASHFGRLKELIPGDEILFTDAQEHEFWYQVAETEILSPDAVPEMNAGEWALSLFTCTLDGQTRFTLRCEKKG